MSRDGPTAIRTQTRRTVLAGLAGAGAALMLPPGLARAERVFPAAGRVEFIGRRQRAVAGTYRFRFAQQSGRFTVRTDIDLDVRSGGATLWRYVHHAEEVWLAGWLDAVVTDTSDDGRRFQVRAERQAGIFTGTVNGAAFTVSGYIIPASLWHRDTPGSQVLFDTVDGRVKVVRSTLLGREAVPAGTATVSARHFAITGGLIRDVWYDAEFGLVRIALPGRDGVPIVFNRV
ncbi:MAG TPA: DUF6134 family protein [Kiloniellales bacterium]|jgi:hypothetical protein